MLSNHYSMFECLGFGFQPILFVFVVIKKFLRSIEILAIRNDITNIILSHG